MIDKPLNAAGSSRRPRPEYTGPLPSSEDIDQACQEAMETDGSDSMRALLYTLQILCDENGIQEPMRSHQGYNLIRGILIGILAERRRRNGAVQ